MKMVFWGVFAAGIVACSVWGIGPVLSRMGGNWLSAPMIVGSVVGLAILALAAMFATGVRPSILASDVAVLAVLVGLAGVKVLVAAMATGGAR